MAGEGEAEGGRSQSQGGRSGASSLGPRLPPGECDPYSPLLLGGGVRGVSSEQGQGPGVTPLTHRLKDPRAPVTAPSPMQNETGISSQMAGPATKPNRPSSKLSSATV